MTVYSCGRCRKEFVSTGRYNRHMARKLPCTKNEAEEPVAADARVEEPVAVTTRPFIKWVGGKTQIIGSVMRLFPRVMNNYFEPFLGGGSVLLALLDYRDSGYIRIAGGIYASDLNSNIIGLYKNVQADPDGLVAEVGKIVGEFSRCADGERNRKAATLDEALASPESYYFWVRAKFNALSREGRTSLVASAMLIFMNKTCFRGVYREGPSGFNVPFGNYKNPTVVIEGHIREVSRKIRDVVFACTPFDEVVAAANAGDFVYLDPPYAPVDCKSFVSYTKDGFDIKQHTKLFGLCRGLKEKNVKMVMSNADVELVLDAFPPSDYVVGVINCRRAINSKKPGKCVDEVLITNRE